MADAEQVRYDVTSSSAGWRTAYCGSLRAVVSLRWPRPQCTNWPINLPPVDRSAVYPIIRYRNQTFPVEFRSLLSSQRENWLIRCPFHELRQNSVGRYGTLRYTGLAFQSAPPARNCGCCAPAAAASCRA